MPITTEEIAALQATELSTSETIALQEKYGAHHYHPLEFAPARATGVWVWDAEGKKVLDCQACYSALGEGHNPINQLCLATVRVQDLRVAITPHHVYSQERSKLLKVLAEMAEMDKALFMNTGGEAFDTVVKAVRRWAKEVKGISGDPEIIVCIDNFHGRTLAATSASSEEHYRRNFGPFLPGFVHVPYGDAQAIRNAITKNTAAVVLEPVIQAEGGIIMAPDGYLTELRQICQDSNVLRVYDEVQVGLGRLGHLFGYLYEGPQAKPNLMMLGKFLGGGVEVISAVVGDARVIDCFDPGSHGSTFAGNPKACAHALEALKTLSRPEFLERVRAMGTYLHSQLELIRQKSSLVEEVRGVGLLQGIKLSPRARDARYYVEELLERGIWMYVARDNVIRISPPLIITKQDFAEAQVFEHLTEILATCE